MSKHPIVVFEGPDGVGKTTLAEAVCKYLDGKYVHLTYRFRDKMHCYHGAALKAALRVSETRPVVIDRWWPSEKVYANAYRGGTQWPEMGRIMERVALRHGVTYVFCLPSDRERYLKHFDELRVKRAEMYDEGMSRVYDGFRAEANRFCAEGRPGVLTYDLFEQGQDLDGFVQSVLENAADLRAGLPEYSLDRSFLNLSGDVTRARCLLVTRSRYSHHRYSPMTAYDRTTIEFCQALDLADVPEPDLACVSVWNPRDQLLANDVVRECSKTMPVLALGAGASIMLKDLGINHEIAPVPTDTNLARHCAFQIKETLL